MDTARWNNSLNFKLTSDKRRLHTAREQLSALATVADDSTTAAHRKAVIEDIAQLRARCVASDAVPRPQLPPLTLVPNPLFDEDGDVVPAKH